MIKKEKRMERTEKVRAGIKFMALAGLSFDPQSDKMQSALVDLLHSNANKISEIEESNIGKAVTNSENEVSEQALDIGKETFKTKMTIISQKHHDQSKNNNLQLTSIKNEISKVDERNLTKLSDFTKGIYELNETYNSDIIVKALPPTTIWEKLAIFIQKSISTPEVLRTIGERNKEFLNMYRINISVDIGEFQKYKAMGLDEKLPLLQKTIGYKINEVLTLLDSMILTIINKS